MRIWKQAVVSVVVLAAAVVLWARYFPVVSGMLQRAGIATAAIEADRDALEASGFAGVPPTVRATPVVRATVNDRVSAIGDGLAAQSVTVTPRVDGRVASIEVASGDFVRTGTALVRLNSEAEEIALDRARLILADAQATLARAEELRRSNAVSEVALRAAALAASQAELALRDAELALEHRLVRAPFDGWVGILGVEVGDQVSTSTPVATLDDRSRILVDFRVPERFAGQLQVGAAVAARPLAQPGLVLAGEIATVDSRISAETRTIRVRASFDNADDRLRAGMAFSIDMRFPGDTFAAVDPLAIQWNADGAYVWTAVDGQAAQVPVRIVQRNDDAVLVDGALGPGAMVVTEGVQMLREGAALRLEGEAPTTANQGGGPRRPRILTHGLARRRRRDGGRVHRALRAPPDPRHRLQQPDRHRRACGGARRRGARAAGRRPPGDHGHHHLRRRRPGDHRPRGHRRHRGGDGPDLGGRGGSRRGRRPGGAG